MKNSNCLAVANLSRCFLISMILLISFSTHAQTMRMRANLYVVDANGTTLMDGNMTDYHSSYSNDLDGYDIWKMSNFGENFGILRSAANLVIERRSPATLTDSSFFRLWNLAQGRSYRITVITQNLSAAGRVGFVFDNYLQKTTFVQLNGTTDVDFVINSAPASYAQNRFTFIMADGSLMAGPLPVSFTGVHAQLTAARSARISWTVQNEDGMDKYIVQHSANGVDFKDIGETQATQLQQRNSYSAQDETNVVARNFYRVKALSLSGKIQYSAVARLNAQLQDLRLDVYPNPVANKQMNLEINVAQNGTYSLLLVNSFGQQVPLGKLNLQTGVTRQTMSLPAAVSPGIYQLKIMTSDHRTLSKTVTIL